MHVFLLTQEHIISYHTSYKRRGYTSNQQGALCVCMCGGAVHVICSRHLISTSAVDSRCSNCFVNPDSIGTVFLKTIATTSGSLRLLCSLGVLDLISTI
jgi:hypothetical protein